ncbi:MAG: hypothetical protein ACI8UO_003867 [Verrucomicrobiales bacterium]|jgi:hypothetical protein
MFLAAIERKSGKEFSLELKDGDFFVIGRQPDLRVASKFTGDRQLLTMTLGDADGTISRTHAWGECRGNALVINRIPPDQGKKTPHPFVSIFESRRQLPDTISLDAGQSFGIHSQGWMEFHWVETLDEMPSHVLNEMPSIELKSMAYAKAGIAPSVLTAQLDLIQHELPKVFSAWSTPEELLTGAAQFIQRSMQGQTAVTATFISVEPGGAGHQILSTPPNQSAEFRPSNRLLTDLYSGSSGLKGTPRVVQSKRASGDIDSMVSITYSFDWILAIPVGAERREAGGEHFQPFLYEGKPVCLYIETREAIDTEPTKLVPFLRLVNSLVASALQAEHERQLRLDEAGQSRELLTAYRKFFLRAVGEITGARTILPDPGDPGRVIHERAADAMAQGDFEACVKGLAWLGDSEAKALRQIANQLFDHPPSTDWREELRRLRADDETQDISDTSL